MMSALKALALISFRLGACLLVSVMAGGLTAVVGVGLALVCYGDIDRALEGLSQDSKLGRVLMGYIAAYTGSVVAGLLCGAVAVRLPLLGFQRFVFGVVVPSCFAAVVVGACGGAWAAGWFPKPDELYFTVSVALGAVAGVAGRMSVWLVDRARRAWRDRRLVPGEGSPSPIA